MPLEGLNGVSGLFQVVGLPDTQALVLLGTLVALDKGFPAGGLCANTVMRVDPVLGNACLTDPIGVSASFYDTMVRIEKV